MKKTLIIGSSGSLGKEILKKYKKNERVLTYNDNVIKSGIKFDAVSMDLENAVKELETFNCAILLLADKNPNSCYKNKKYSNKLNVLSIKYHPTAIPVEVNTNVATATISIELNT